jgi:EmrB/QacA subfamily drug resistance transporter
VSTEAGVRRKRLALAAAIMGSFVAGLDATVVNVALPAIERDLGGGLATQQWVVNGYMLALGSLILVGGSLGDVFGERLIFALGAGGFGLASVACAAAPTAETLIAARVLQGAFGALLTPSALAVIVSAFPPAERGAAIGSWTAWSGVAFIVGPVVGGQIVDVASWRWIFALNVPFIAITLLLVRLALPAPTGERRIRSVDWPGGVLSLLGLAGPVYALIRQPQLGWGDSEVLVPLVAGIVLLGAFLRREATIGDPMLPLGLFRRRNFAIANLQTFAMYGGLAVLGFFLALFLQEVAGYSALEAGFASLPSTVVMLVLSKRAGALADRFGPRAFMAGGPLVSAIGLLMMLRVGAEVDYVGDLLLPLLVFSFGLTATVAPLTVTVLADAEEANAGIASGISNAIARVAALVAVAGLAPVLAAFGEAEVSVRSFHVAMALAAVLLAISAVVAAAGIRNAPRR